MPDISMCDSMTCPLRKTCHRNNASGTKPGLGQSWLAINPGTCDYETSECYFYWEVKRNAKRK